MIWFDEVGNRTVKTNGGTTVSYTYSNGCNRLTGWSATSTNGFTGVIGDSLCNSLTSNTL
jgi:hypothetical protein